MCKFWLDVCVVITLVQIQFISGDLSIDQKIREGNRKRQRELGVRLVGGSSSLEGRIEIWHNNTWGTVCDDRFDRKDAEVICHMLGYHRLGATPYMLAEYGKGNGPIWLDELQCHGIELSVKDCPHLPWGSHDCRHIEDAGVKCRAKKNDRRNRMITLEHDIVVEETEKHKIFDRYKSYRKNAVKDPSKRWYGGTIVYVFGDGIDNNTANLIRDALDEWGHYSCIDFSKSVSNDHYNQIVFTSNQDYKGCASTHIGMKPGSQKIHLGKDCFHRDIILHEVGHALGFYHEHNRADRDSYIKIYYENIEQGKEDSLKKMKQNFYEDYGKPYDYKSIMHYGQYFFSKNKNITIETLKPEYQDEIGKARHPSFLDYKILNTMYECSARCDNDKCPVNGFLGKNCHCYCEGNEDDQPIKPCFDKFLDRRNETEVDISTINHFPDETVLSFFSTNWNCNLASQLQCDNGTWKGNIQDCPVQLELQFVDGSDNEGIVEAELNGQLGYICDDDWDDNEATVACRMMGFESGKARFDISSNANKSLPILLDDVKCSGNESTLSDCTHNDWGIHDCAYTEVAAIECFDNRHTKHIDVLSNYDCGKIPLKGLKRKKRQSRIVGGFEAIKGMHPWQVGIQRLRKRWIRWCGGTIISSHWILSAAHCFDDLSRQKDGRDAKMNYEDVRVYIGDHDWTEHDEYEQIFQIEYLVKHWQYSDREYPPKHDVALLKIRSKSGDGAVFNDYVQPACLPGENDRLYYEMKCEISGWGRRAENGTTSNVLMSVEVPIVDERKCEEFYKHYNIDLQKVFCAGDVIIGTDTCHGDSGGPFVCDINETNTVTGITSWGDGCGRPDALGVYTNVAVYVSWIKEQISRHDLVERCDPDDLSNAVVKDKKGERIRTKIPSGTEVYLSCQYGYEYYSDGQPMDKPVIRECVKGTIINAPDCEKKRCDPDDLSNAVVKYKKGERIRTKIPSGTEVYLSCQYGYEYYSDGQPMDKPVIRECVKGTIINAPDCEKTVVYLISVKTAYYILFGEGTDANVYITLHGLRGETEKMYLEGSFEAGNLDETRVKAKDVRPVTSVVIGHDGSGSYPDWLLEYVSIYVDNMKEYYVFRHNDWVKAERDVRLHRQVLGQQTCIDSFDSGHKWWPRWSSIRSEDKYNISSHRRMSLRACKQACINRQDMQCKAVMYSNDHKSCYGLAVSDTSYFSYHRTWNSPVYLRTCKQFD